MQYLKTYLKKITDRGNTKLAESIEKTANWSVIGKCSVWKNGPDVWDYM